jgi:integrase
MADQDFNATTLLERLERERDKLTVALLAPNTRKRYHYGWRSFLAFCGRLNAVPLPASPNTVSLFAVHLLAAGLKVATVKHHLAAIARRHRDEKRDSPVTTEVKGLLLAARRVRLDQISQVLPLSLDNLRAISQGLLCDDTALALRNRALLLVGFASALRSANLAELLLEDVEFSERGVVLKIRHSKTDQFAKGRLIGIPHGKHPDTCPVRALESWIGRRGSFPGPLFSRLDWHPGRDRAIAPERICQIVQQAVARIGLNPKRYGSHSMRAGFVTAAAECGAGELQIASQTLHKDLSVLRGYFRRQDVFRGNPVGMLDL